MLSLLKALLSSSLFSFTLKELLDFFALLKVATLSVVLVSCLLLLVVVVDCLLTSSAELTNEAENGSVESESLIYCTLSRHACLKHNVIILEFV